MLLFIVFYQTINRGLLRWLKLWDFVVYGIANKSILSKTQDSRSKKRNETVMGGKKFQQKNSDENPEDLLDKNNRPIHKVVLLNKTLMCSLCRYRFLFCGRTKDLKSNSYLHFTKFYRIQEVILKINLVLRF